jgi:hypothetical protein
MLSPLFETVQHARGTKYNKKFPLLLFLLSLQHCGWQQARPSKRKVVHTFICKACLLLQHKFLVALNGLLVFGYDKTLSARTGRHCHSLPPWHEVEFVVSASNTSFFIVSIDRGCSRLLPKITACDFLKPVL